MVISTLVITKSTIKWICLILFTLMTLDLTATQACDIGDFCTYKCRCSQNCTGTGGLCPNNAKCSSGWFGLRCQYLDLLTSYKGHLDFDPDQKNSDWLTDRNDSTCNSDTNLKSITVSWDRTYPLTWIRVVLADPRMMSTLRILYDKTKCQKQTWSSIDKTTMDIRCEDTALIQTVTVAGNITSICSLYISGGRNIAFNQSASQSSTYKEGSTLFGANLAVDGNTDAEFYHESCSHTLNQSKSSLNLSLNSDYAVNRIVLFNRAGDYQYRINGFNILTFNPSGNLVNNYTDPYRNSQLYYYLNFASTDSISSLSISKPGILTLCEVELYGECPAGKWSLPCTKQCKTSCLTSCHRDDGSCNTVCAGYSNPPNCTNVCNDHKWGINCLIDCSSRCTDSICDSLTGLCLAGCLGYQDPPYCYQDCSNVTWGINCSQSCSSACVSNSCDSFNGQCHNCSRLGVYLPDCVKACSLGYWGYNCSLRCSKKCYNEDCNTVTGVCNNGCADGFQFPNCTEACDNGTYGRNCSFNCSVNCLGELCDTTNGHCQCKIGFEGSICEAETSTASVGAIVGPIVAAIIVIAIIIAVVILWRRNRQLKRNKRFDNIRSGQDNFPALDNKHDEASDVNKNNKYTLEDPETQYELVQPVEAESNLISVESLNTYISSRGKDFYTQQFKKIPAVENVTQEIGKSKENKQKNRYQNICPYDHSRVHLIINTDKSEMDYINASYIRGFNGEVNFIAAQGPQKATLSDFIRMLWEQKIDVVVMLTDLIEGNKVKCERYWPESGKLRFGYIKINLGSTQVFADYTIRKLELSKKGEATHIFTQFHFTSWPDKGVPSTQWSLVDVEQKVTINNTKRPIVVHCSAGVGRTGTFIALYNIMRQAEETGCVDFFHTVSKLREDRTLMVQTGSQYEFLHKAAQVAIACMRTTFSIHDFTERLKFLEEKNASGHSKMETEFNGLCAILVKQETDFEEEHCIYENTDAGNEENDYELEYVEKNEDKKKYVFLPGYKQRDQHILAKLPTTTTEAEDFWNLVLKYNITLIVSFEVDSNEKNTADFLPSSLDKSLALQSMEIKLKEKNQRRFFQEQKLNVQSHKSVTFLSKSHTNAITHLKCLFTELEPKNVLEVLKKAKLCFSQTGGKIIYLCSDGVSISGYMAVLSLLLDRVDNELCVSLPLVVGTIKSLQPKIIATLAQYQNLYHTVGRHIETSTQYNNMELANYQSTDTLRRADDVKTDKSNLQTVENITKAENTTDKAEQSIPYENFA